MNRSNCDTDEDETPNKNYHGDRTPVFDYGQTKNEFIFLLRPRTNRRRCFPSMKPQTAPERRGARLFSLIETGAVHSNETAEVFLCAASLENLSV